VFLNKCRLSGSFVGDLDPDLTSFMADTPDVWGVEPLAAEVTEPAWRIKPASHRIATEDGVILPRAAWLIARRAYATPAQLAGSHSLCVFARDEPAALIDTAAKEVGYSCRPTPQRPGPAGQRDLRE
jgi:hypothetical protein